MSSLSLVTLVLEFDLLLTVLLRCFYFLLLFKTLKKYHPRLLVFLCDPVLSPQSKTSLSVSIEKISSKALYFEMTAQKIKEGMFLISWEPYLHFHSRNPFEDKVEVKSINTEVFESCKLKTYQRNKTNKDWQETKKATVLLEMEIVFAKAVNSDKVKSVLASKGDIQNKMVFQD